MDSSTRKKQPAASKTEMMLNTGVKWLEENGRFKRSVTIRPHRIGELAAFYSVSNHVIKTWLKPLADQLGRCVKRCYSATQVEIIFRELGVPGWMEIKSSKLYPLRNAKVRPADLQTHKRAGNKGQVKKHKRGERGK